jgi:alkaline phosphatase
LKTYNGGIGVDLQGKPCGTVLEAAKQKGMLTGLVATSRITHATPASFAAHVALRDDEAEIAIHEIGNQTLGRTVDLLLGGGKWYSLLISFFLPQDDPQSCRSDDYDVFKMARNIGWNVGNGMDDFKNDKASTLPLMNLFALDHMDYDIDRDPLVQPSLTEMSLQALELLHSKSKEQNTGFFLMIEGSRIDMAAHSNNPAAHLYDIFAYNEAIALVKDFVDLNDDTVMISVSDHETGGFSVAHQLNSTYPEYQWYPQYVTPVRHSGEYISKQIKTQKSFGPREFLLDIVLKQWLGIDHPDPKDVEYLLDEQKSMTEIDYYLGKMTSDLAGLGWSTHGHSGVDVNLYAYGARSTELMGNHENTEIGDFIIRSLDLQLEPITKTLNSKIH